MQTINNFSIAQKSDVSSSLDFNGSPIPTVVPGLVLETQFLVGEKYYLLMLTDDSPFEEGLHIVLLRKDFTLVDKIDVSQIYTPGTLTDVVIVADNQLEFNFIGEQKFRVTILQQEKLELFRNIKYSFISQQGLFKKKHLLIDLVDKEI